MSGLLRRIKRSRAAGAGDPPAEGQAAGPEGAHTTAEAGAATPAGDEARTSELPAATAPAIRADPALPAGLDEREAAAVPPAGRRGRLRRRLRYLRRARELMLRDLGGLSYEVHRTGGGDFGAHSAVIGGKVERLAILDAEAGAIERKLGAPRSEAVVFQPGVGGTCDVCGELYGSAARFCSHCGTPTDPAARAAPAPVTEPRDVPPMPKAPGTAETQVLAPAAAGHEAAAGEAEARAEEPQADEVEADEPPADDVEANEPPPGEAAAPEQPPAEEPAKPDPGRNPFSSLSNGRPEDEGASPELSSGDPLGARESRQ
jgi:hypothetical protein